MIEKRNSERIPTTMQMCISALYKENNLVSGIHDLNSPIQIINISKTGFSFVSECVLPTGYCFNADLKLDDSTCKIFTLVRIIHSQPIDRNQYLYGCEFTPQSENISLLLEHAAD